MIREAIILAGGLGTRLKNVISDIPKPMALINGNPFLYYLLNYLQTEGVERVILSVGYKHEVISGYFGNTHRSMQIEYAIEDKPLGTGGAIALALEKTKSNNVFIFNGDTFFPIPLKEMDELHRVTNAEITLALKKVENTNRYGTVSINSKSIITSFAEKSTSGSSNINGGIYLLNKHEFRKRELTGRFSFEKDYLEKVANESCISGSVFNNYFIDIGIPESYKKAQQEFYQFG